MDQKIPDNVIRDDDTKTSTDYASIMISGCRLQLSKTNDY